MEIGNRNKKGTKVTRFLGEGRGRGDDRPFCFAALSKRRGIRGLPRNGGGNMDRVNRLFFFFLFFFLLFFFPFSRDRDGERISGDRVLKIKSRGFGVKRYEIEEIENCFFDSINLLVINY